VAYFKLTHVSIAVILYHLQALPQDDTCLLNLSLKNESIGALELLLDVVDVREGKSESLNVFNSLDGEEAFGHN
jgi:hypothetical protein